MTEKYDYRNRPIKRIGKNWRKYRLSENFWLGEFVVSADHPEVAAKITPTVRQAQRIQLIVVSILQPERNRYGRIDVTNGIRSPELNGLVGGQATSFHLDGAAVDFTSDHLEEVYGHIGASRYFRVLYCDIARNFCHVSINIPERAPEFINRFAYGF